MYWFTFYIRKNLLHPSYRNIQCLLNGFVNSNAKPFNVVLTYFNHYNLLIRCLEVVHRLDSIYNIAAILDVLDDFL